VHVIQVTFNTSSSLRTIHSKDGKVFKGDEFYGVLDGGPHGARSIQMTADDEEHAARRRILDRALPKGAQAFTTVDNLARVMVCTVKDHAGTTTAGEWSSPIEISAIIRWYSFDIISKVSFGQSLDLLGSEQFRWLPMCLERTSVFIYSIAFERNVTFWRWFMGTSLPSRLRMADAVEAQRYNAFATDLFNKRKAKFQADVKKGAEPDAKDLFAHLLQANQCSDADLQADSSLLVAAGSDAVRLTSLATIFYLLKYPRTLEKITAEIRSVVDSADMISNAALSSMEYLRACVDEALRLSPPKAASIPREVGKGGITVDGIFVPQGMTVAVSVYSLHHDPEVFPDPYAYRPERWIEAGNDQRMQAAFCPLLKGPRRCPGGTVAYLAIQLALFHLLYNYDICFAPGGADADGLSGQSRLRWRQDEYHMNDWIIGFANGPIIRTRARARAK